MKDTVNGRLILSERPVTSFLSLFVSFCCSFGCKQLSEEQALRPSCFAHSLRFHEKHLKKLLKLVDNNLGLVYSNSVVS